MTDTILLVFAFVLFVCATVGVGSKYNLVAAGLACYIATLLF